MKTSVTILSILSIAFSSLTFAIENQEQRDMIESQLSNNPSELIYKNILQAYPEFAPEFLSILLKQDGIDSQKAIEAAILAAPDKVLEIAQIARDAEVSNEDITSAALLAGIDPTQVAEASAAGIPTNTPVTPISPVSPPSAPSVGGQGGGGSGVVSPS
ncbi:hypothetical protein PVK63_08820 [Aliivibrio sp. S2TY2]|uniref:hypothetical protein n=1 Tax=unclassified Aliivibrio TaxID=2645654 RepID=UPI002379EEC5|nr:MULTISPECIES: hypothetical protein [unclassified Aliivibrio]MDD9175002.1 hypothetical protein [Aliivibrio sp. S3TY1]MDD9192051.1 hypothetical protein [Aliivibrio sp. S2TY2]